jgi:hypothetical protein
MWEGQPEKHIKSYFETFIDKLQSDGFNRNNFQLIS